MDQFEKNKELSDTPAMPEMQDSVEQTYGAQETALPVSTKPNGGTAEPAQPVVKPNGSAGSTETQNTGAANNDKSGKAAPPIIAKPNGKDPEAAQLATPQGELDPFDPRNHKKPQDPRLNPGAFAATSGLPSTIYIGKPKKSWYIRFHPDPAYRAVLPLYTDDDVKRREGNDYLFAPGLQIPPDLEDLVRDTLVVAAITSSGVPFVYKLPVTDSSWYESGLELIVLVTEEWKRVAAGDGCYVMKSPIAKIDEPIFPDAPFRNWLERAFSKRLIKSLDDPLVKKLRGAR